MGLLFLPGSWAKGPMQTKEATRVWTAMSMTERPSRRQLQRDSSLYWSRVKALKGSSGYRWKGLISDNLAPNYHTGGEKKSRTSVLSHTAFAGSICRVVLQTKSGI